MAGAAVVFWAWVGGLVAGAAVVGASVIADVAGGDVTEEVADAPGEVESLRVVVGDSMSDWPVCTVSPFWLVSSSVTAIAVMTMATTLMTISAARQPFRLLAAEGTGCGVPTGPEGAGVTGAPPTGTAVVGGGGTGGAAGEAMVGWDEHGLLGGNGAGGSGGTSAAWSPRLDAWPGASTVWVGSASADEPSRALDWLGFTSLLSGP